MQMDLIGLEIVRAIAKRHQRLNALPMGLASDCIEIPSMVKRLRASISDTSSIHSPSGLEEATKLVQSLPIHVDVHARRTLDLMSYRQGVLETTIQVRQKKDAPYFQIWHFNTNNVILQLGRHLDFLMESIEAVERRVVTLEQKAIEVKKELYEALACTFEAEQEFRDQKE